MAKRRFLMYLLFQAHGLAFGTLLLPPEEAPAQPYDPSQAASGEGSIIIMRPERSFPPPLGPPIYISTPEPSGQP